MKIRFGTIDDLAEVQRLNKALTLYERENVLHNQSINEGWAFQPNGVAHWTNYLKGENNAAVVIAEDKGKVVGYLAGNCRSNPHRHQNPLAEIETMFVEASRRGEGVGSKLMEAFKAWALGMGAVHFEVMAWSDNHPAVGFYRHLGFKEDAVRLAQPAPEK